jgi:DnaJ-class molecular chaperone
MRRHDWQTFTEKVDCEDCDGTGYVSVEDFEKDQECEECGGTGKVTITTELDMCDMANWDEDTLPGRIGR